MSAQETIPLDDEFCRAEVIRFIGLSDEIRELVRGIQTTKPEVFKSGPFSIIGGEDIDDTELFYSPRNLRLRQDKFATGFTLKSTLGWRGTTQPEVVSPEKPLAMRITRCTSRPQYSEWEEFIQRVAQTYKDKPALEYGMRYIIAKTAYRATIAGDLEKYIYPPPSATDQENIFSKPGSHEAAAIIGGLYFNMDSNSRLGYIPVAPEPGDFELIGYTLTEMRDTLPSI